jgi:hypothetical protein
MSRTYLPLFLTLLLASAGSAKDKSKAALPADVLNARTVLVVINPEAGESLTDPNANVQARADVEKALTKWGRFDLVMEARSADLVIAVRRGSGKAVTPTVKGGPLDQQPVILQPQDGSIRIGGRRGRPDDVTSSETGSSDPSPHIQTEVGSKDDRFEVYRGGVIYPLDSSPVWRYIAKDALRAPSVAAVEQFRKAIDQAMQAAAKKKQP